MVSMDPSAYVEQLLDDHKCDLAREYLRTEEGSMPSHEAERLWAMIREKERLLEVS